MAVLLITSSIALAFVQAFTLHDIAGGVLTYIAQAFLLAGSIFGLDYYVRKLISDDISHSNNMPGWHDSQNSLR